jgi:hypothetical protein
MYSIRCHHSPWGYTYSRLKDTALDNPFKVAMLLTLLAGCPLSLGIFEALYYKPEDRWFYSMEQLHL